MLICSITHPSTGGSLDNNEVTRLDSTRVGSKVPTDPLLPLCSSSASDQGRTAPSTNQQHRKRHSASLAAILAPRKFFFAPVLLGRTRGQRGSGS